MWARLIKEMKAWLDAKGYETARELTGAYIRNLEAEGVGLQEGVGTVGRVHFEGPPPTVIPEKCTLCDLCVKSCEYDALRINKEEDPDAVIVEGDRCFVCGLCVTVCPTEALVIDLDLKLGPHGPVRP
jgi:NAD-dependent dihydropyrimidine dehydrogenase PreA subunit